MTIDAIGARDEIFGMFATAWDANAGTIVGGSAPAVYYQGVTEKEIAPPHNYWVRVSMVTSQEGQRSFPIGDGTARNTTDGQLFIELYLPKSAQLSWQNGLRLAKLARDVYKFNRSEPSGAILFQNTRMQELPPQESWHRINIISDYTYDETITLE